jgi:aldose 1-epimerase
MSQLVRLRSGRCQAVFDPLDGGRLTSFRVDGRQLLVTQGADVYHWGSFVLAPWTGRLRDAEFSWAGQTYRFAANAGRHALHGLATTRAWQVVSPEELVLELADPWPWRGRVIQRAQLGEDQAWFQIEVRADEPMPVAVGWHPWFARRLGQADLAVEVRPGLMWAHDDSDLPTGALTRPVAPPWDYCFRDLAADPVLTWPGQLRLRVSSDCADWVIYDHEPAGICVEPWTAPPNSLNLPDPQVVSPGQPLTATMTWHWD